MGPESLGRKPSSMFNFFNGPGGGTFEASYRCYPVSFIDKIDAEAGDKVFLPPSALDRLGNRSFSFSCQGKIEKAQVSGSMGSM